VAQEPGGQPKPARHRFAPARIRVPGAGQDQHRGGRTIRKRLGNRLEQGRNRLARVKSPEIEPVRAAAGQAGSKRHAVGLFCRSEPARERIRHDLDPVRGGREVLLDVGSARLAHGHDRGRFAGRGGESTAIERPVEPRWPRPRDVARKAPGNQIVDGQDRRKGEPLRQPMIPRSVKEIGSRVDAPEESGQRIPFPSNPPARAPADENRDGRRNPAMGYGAVRDAHKRGALPLELFENLPDDDPDARNGLERERAEVDGDSKIAGHRRHATGAGASGQRSLASYALTSPCAARYPHGMRHHGGPRASHLGHRLAE